MSPTRLILCRHGESEGNRDGRFGGHGPAPLTERGRAQAQATGLRLLHEGADAIYCSDLVRAEETAVLIGQQLSLTPQRTPALRERSVGIFTGLSFDEARARYPEEYGVLLQREPDVAPPEGESYLQCSARASRFLEQALTQHRGQRVVLVSHYLTVHLLVLHIMGVKLTADAPRVYVQLHNCGLHRFEHYDDGAWQVLALNETAHLSVVL
jgi:2,3-bisphosphoglycerate-dependent phosphoglycerate mutase